MRDAALFVLILAGTLAMVGGAGALSHVGTTAVWLIMLGLGVSMLAGYAGGAQARKARQEGRRSGWTTVGDIGTVFLMIVGFPLSLIFWYAYFGRPSDPPQANA